MAAARNGKIDNCKFLLDNKAEINKVNIHGSTALLQAAEYSDAKICKFLLENGADADKVDEDGFTALMRAAEVAKIDTCQILLDRGVDVDPVNKYGYTALELSMGKTKLFLKKAIMTLKSKTKEGAIELVSRESEGREVVSEPWEALAESPPTEEHATGLSGIVASEHNL